MVEAEKSACSDSQDEVEDKTMAPFPFKFHALRDGEPPVPAFINPTSDRLNKTPTPDIELRRIWREWAVRQPDARLLYTEYVFAQLWANAKGKLNPDEAVSFIEEQRKDAQHLREQGFGEVVERYWSHLIPPDSA